MKPTLSIIIVSFNTKSLTLDAISSVYQEGSNLSIQIIVIDNNSQDGSVEALRNLASKYENFLLIENSGNLGFAKANNQGIRKAKGEYLLLLNSDTVVKKGALGKLVNFAKETPDAGVVGPRLLNKDGSVQKGCYHFPTIGRAISEYWLGRKGYFDSFAPQGGFPVTVDVLVGAAFLITPKALKKVGLLDERYFFYFDDIDYCRRVWREGLKVYYYPKAEIVHLVGASGKKIADPANQWRRLIPSSKIYHGTLKHYLLTFILWLGQKWEKIFKKN